MYLFRSKDTGGKEHAVAVYFPVDVKKQGEQATLKLEERISGLYEELRLPIYRYLLHMNMLPQDAEEIIQETFLKLYEHLHAGGRLENTRGWVFRVAHNSSVNNLKSRRFHFTASEEEWVKFVDTVVDPAAGPEEALLQKEKLMRLHTTMAALSPLQSQCLQLRMEGFRYREIAEILSVAIPTVGESLRRAMEKITRDPNEQRG